MIKPQGYATIFGNFAGGDTTIERDTITCGHCNQIILVKPGTISTIYLTPQMNGPDKEDAGAFCRQCMSSICVKCCDAGLCTPLMRRIEEMEAKDRLWANIVRG